MDHDTGATLLFDLEGVAVSRAYRDMDGVPSWKVKTVGSVSNSSRKYPP
jgi:hypothetical protein